MQTLLMLCVYFSVLYIGKPKTVNSFFFSVRSHLMWNGFSVYSFLFCFVHFDPRSMVPSWTNSMLMIEIIIKLKSMFRQTNRKKMERSTFEFGHLFGKTKYDYCVCVCVCVRLIINQRVKSFQSRAFFNAPFQVQKKNRNWIGRHAFVLLMIFACR